MSTFISFIEYVPGVDKFGDLIARQAEKHDRMERFRWPYNHVAIIIGDKEYGYYRADCLTTGLEYSHAWNLPVGVSFHLDRCLPEKEVFFRAWHPSAKEKYHTDWRQTKRQLRGETYTPIDFETGAMNCVTFALLCAGRLDLPHRFPELFQALQKEGCLQINIRTQEQKEPHGGQ